MATLSQLKAQYKKNKSAKVGDTCHCPSCGTGFIKENYQQAFSEGIGIDFDDPSWDAHKSY